MPRYQITFSTPNKPIGGEAQDDTSVTTTMRGSTPEKAVENALQFSIFQGYESTEIVELDEDGLPVHPQPA